MDKIKVGILGCTGAVGQKFIALLEGHPFFEISAISASEKSAGQKFGERVNWIETTPLPENIADMVISDCTGDLDAKILFSALDSSVAGDVETQMADRGHVVVSNSKNHRMDENVPLIIPEINGDHFALINSQPGKNSSGGFIVTNPNCATVVLALSLYPFHKNFGVESVIVTTMQAVSGAGYPGVPALDILGNLIPHIGGGEEEKLETEPLKILGSLDQNKIKFADFNVSASVNRVPVRDGHTVSVSVKLKNPASKEEILRAIDAAPTLDLPSAPEQLLRYLDTPGRPRPLTDAYAGNGMSVTVGHLRPCTVLHWKYTALGHNTIRGAAGAAILNAEYMVKNNLLS
ncbi:MAG: aspartate-semialdehyde dehydrogenase [Ignavibacteriae bacterium]|nr:aspartate-semialdehyde dehydrogenase [Ignavibacteriota bacterium]MCB9244673.1 aspartate-semialdehyde dehydrogenase [Ignavibacteriales bacterium]